MKRNILSFAMIFAASICFAKGNKVYNTFKMNSGDVKEYRLKNGIPVYINDSVPNKVCSVFIIVEGGTMIAINIAYRAMPKAFVTSLGKTLPASEPISVPNDQPK